MPLYTDNLQSLRLTTRFVTPDDVPAWIEYCADPLATTFTAIPDHTPEQMARSWIDLTMKRYRENRYGGQALIDKEHNELVGICGLLAQEVNGKAETEIGYHLLRRHWGKGYATEAAELFRDYAFNHNLADSVVSIIHPDNIPSQKVALRNGMRLVDNHADFRGKEYFLFRITKEEWQQMRTA